MNEFSSHQPDVAGCLIKVTLIVICTVALTIFFIGIVAGIVIAGST